MKTAKQGSRTRKASTPDLSRKNSNRDKQYIEKVVYDVLKKSVYDILKKMLPPELLNKQKSVWDSSLPIRIETPIQTSPTPDFTNYRDPPQEISDTTDEDEAEETLDDTMEIDFVKKEDKEAPTSIATVRCKIKNLKIPAAILNSGAECSIMSYDIAKH